MTNMNDENETAYNVIDEIKNYCEDRKDYAPVDNYLGAFYSFGKIKAKDDLKTIISELSDLDEHDELVKSIILYLRERITILDTQVRDTINNRYNKKGVCEFVYITGQYNVLKYALDWFKEHEK